MTDDFTRIDLKKALREGGCPICRLRIEAEEHYVRDLLRECVNDVSTRERFLASWGYCARHARLLGLIEVKEFGDGTGNAIMYESLARRAEKWLTRVRGEVAQHEIHPKLHTLRALWNPSKHVPLSLTLEKGCRVCEIGTDSAAYTLKGLLEALENQEAWIADLYLASEGLCLPHLRSALTQIYSQQRRLSELLIDHAQKGLLALQLHLAEYLRKHSWSFREERITREERESWSKAITFFSGGIPEDVPRERTDAE